MNEIFLCGVPLLAISSHIKHHEPYIIGVHKGFERVIASRKHIPFLRLYEAKLSILSFRNANLFSVFLSLPQTFWALFLIVLNYFLCTYYLLRHKPLLILSAGGFSAVPLIFSANILKTLRVLDTTIIIHQQDSIPGLTNKLTAKLSQVLTCVYPKTLTYTNFSNAEIIPNPIDETMYSSVSLKAYQTKEPFKSFLELSTLPVLLIYGGGSGAKAINDWVSKDIDSLCNHFRVIHLIGELQTNPEHFLGIKTIGYLPIISLYDEMPFVLSISNLVISRAGLGAITELKYLNKQAFLVPLPNSHQEANAEQEANRFGILKQENINNWLPLILRYKEILPKIEPIENGLHSESLVKYYDKLQTFLDKNQS
jgi:UDP-N-acetylglucosamine--N-acetylmuramyl-(pentapeptide) pyrophosphoryl-undecaprenol N-acetylglucosamine transferase